MLYSPNICSTSVPMLSITVVSISSVPIPIGAISPRATTASAHKVITPSSPLKTAVPILFTTPVSRTVARSIRYVYIRCSRTKTAGSWLLPSNIQVNR